MALAARKEFEMAQGILPAQAIVRMHERGEITGAAFEPGRCSRRASICASASAPGACARAFCRPPARASPSG